jgi:hypothetical protein
MYETFWNYNLQLELLIECCSSCGGARGSRKGGNGPLLVYSANVAPAILVPSYFDTRCTFEFAARVALCFLTSDYLPCCLKYKIWRNRN